jgi:plastocyanin
MISRTTHMSTNGITTSVVVGLVAGIGFIIIIYLVFASLSTGLGTSHVSIVIIPNGTAAAAPDDSAMKQGYQPKEIKVVVGLNNTVRWINEDMISYSVVADNFDDPNFFNATIDSDGNPTDQARLLPRESFEFTFTKAGIFDYHGVPHPWMRGTVIVLEQ